MVVLWAILEILDSLLLFLGGLLHHQGQEGISLSMAKYARAYKERAPVDDKSESRISRISSIRGLPPLPLFHQFLSRYVPIADG